MAMKTVKCPACGGKTKRNGKTSSGAQRWRCLSCGASTTQKYSRETSELALFLDWLLSKKTQSEMPMAPRTFRAKTHRFWSIWPVCPVCDEIHHVVHVDGIWLKRICVILIAYADGHVIGWYLARSENAKAWYALIRRIAPPDVVITDGAEGFEKARKAAWPDTRVQRCLFHAFNQVKRCTTTRPKTQAGVDLYAIAKNLLHIDDLNDAAAWLGAFAQWCSTYEEFLKERTVIDGKIRYKHERLRKARRALQGLCRANTLFTYLDEELTESGVIPATNNALEGFNAQIREILRNHRGMCLDHMIKTVFWFCQSKMEYPPAPKQILREQITDDTISMLYQQAEVVGKRDALVERWGNAIEWKEFHTETSYRDGYD